MKIICTLFRLINFSYISQTALIGDLKHIGETLAEIEITQTNMKRILFPKLKGKREDDGPGWMPRVWDTSRNSIGSYVCQTLCCL